MDAKIEVPEPLMTVRVRLGPQAPARARSFLHAFVDEIPRFDDAMLAVSEVVTNVLSHGKPLADGTVELRVLTKGATVRIEVKSGTSGEPSLRTSSDSTQSHGRGLQILSRLSDRWGFLSAGELVVWFELGNPGHLQMAPDVPDPMDEASLLHYLDHAVSAGPWRRIAVDCPAISPHLLVASLGPYTTSEVRDPASPVLAGGLHHETSRSGVTVNAIGEADADIAVIDRLCTQIAEALRSSRIQSDAEVLDDLRFLSEASHLLASSIEYEQTLRLVAQLAVPNRAHWCTINVLDHHQAIRRVAVEHSDPKMSRHLEQLLDSHPHDPDATSGVPLVIRTGDPLLFPEVDDQILSDTANSEEYLEITRALSIRSCMIVPLVAGDIVLGAASFVSTDLDHIRYDQQSLAVAVDLGKRAGAAIVNARKYADRSRLVEALSATLLPDRIPDIGGADIAAEYRAAVGDLQVGGDFYDVVEAVSGSWYVMVGDVQGKGMDAATLIGLARHTLRAAALRDADPVEALTSLNRALLASPIARTCTAVCARFESDGDEVAMIVARAGHTPPVAILDTTLEMIEPPGVLLGFVDDIGLHRYEGRLVPGDLVSFHSDGVLARFDEDESAVAGAVVDAYPDPKAVVRALAGEPHTALRDDIAVVAVRIKPRSA